MYCIYVFICHALFSCIAFTHFLYICNVDSDSRGAVQLACTSSVCFHVQQQFLSYGFYRLVPGLQELTIGNNLLYYVGEPCEIISHFALYRNDRCQLKIYFRICTTHWTLLNSNFIFIRTLLLASIYLILIVSPETKSHRMQSLTIEKLVSYTYRACCGQRLCCAWQPGNCLSQREWHLVW